jgi:site-specific DNA-cytosine methylase
MELKPYQQKVLDDLEEFLGYLQRNKKSNTFDITNRKVYARENDTMICVPYFVHKTALRPIVTPFSDATFDHNTGSIITGNNSVYRDYDAVDLFCGAGGLTKGLSQAGIEVKMGVDIDPACKFPYTANNDSEFLMRSVEDLEAWEIESAFRKNGIRLIAGCAPCQTFSTYNQKAAEDDKRWWLLQQFSRLVLEIKPELVMMENVPGLEDQLEDQEVFQDFLTDFRRGHYFFNHCIVNCADYGVPQHRHRLVLLASRLGPIKLLTPKEFGARPRSVKQAIGSLPLIQVGAVHPTGRSQRQAAPRRSMDQQTSARRAQRTGGELSHEKKYLIPIDRFRPLCLYL